MEWTCLRRFGCKKIFLLSLAFLLLFCPATGSAGQLRQIRTNDLAVLFDIPVMKKAASEVAKIYPAVRAELSAAIGWEPGFYPTVYLVGSAETFQRMAGTHLITAFAIPKKNLIVIDHTRMNLHPITLSVTLKHELCHLLLHHHINTVRLPRWLDEGVAQWVSDGFSELTLPKKKQFLQAAVLSDDTIRLSRLSVRFPDSRDGLLLAYEESRSVVDYIVMTFGRDGLLQTLNLMRQGYETDEAIREALSVSLTDLERQWHLHLRKTGTWLLYIAVHIYEILFFMAALLTVYGFFRLTLKKQRYQDDDDDEDENDDLSQEEILPAEESR
ncbi:hypothetical protein DENIS_3511 [Desulfonema ishimotonii]|uniref:Peptidase MA-like domain-containing protein n=1 Tax=Desulfonema ishimotonii TaxID=45657 RepID=A0A401FZY2_9BACT|nr:peptidase MA family metallohydrolase [Desulfonema ishimotonii]GBC62539.1 hypothetical protein DENIS_3511 [Desulfonema ishimotonii]